MTDRYTVGRFLEEMRDRGALHARVYDCIMGWLRRTQGSVEVDLFCAMTASKQVVEMAEIALSAACTKGEINDKQLTVLQADLAALARERGLVPAP